jgi:hypothetical protein
MDDFNEIDFDPNRMTLATPEDVERMYRALWGTKPMNRRNEMTERAKRFRGLLIVIPISKEGEAALWAIEHGAEEEYDALIALKKSTEAPRDERFAPSNWRTE